MPKEIQSINQFKGGVNTRVDSRDVGEEFVIDALNLMCDIEGQVRQMARDYEHSEMLDATITGTIVPGSGLYQFGSDYPISDELLAGTLANPTITQVPTGNHDILVTSNNNYMSFYCYPHNASDVFRIGPVVNNVDPMIIYSKVDGILRVCDANHDNIDIILAPTTDSNETFDPANSNFMNKSFFFADRQQWVGPENNQPNGQTDILIRGWGSHLGANTTKNGLDAFIYPPTCDSTLTVLSTTAGRSHNLTHQHETLSTQTVYPTYMTAGSIGILTAVGTAVADSDWLADTYNFGVSFVYHGGQESPVTNFHENFGHVHTSDGVTFKFKPYVGKDDQVSGPNWDQNFDAFDTRIIGCNFYLAGDTSGFYEDPYFLCEFYWGSSFADPPKITTSDGTIMTDIYVDSSSHTVQHPNSFVEIVKTPVITFSMRTGYRSDSLSIACNYKTAVIANRRLYAAGLRRWTWDTTKVATEDFQDGQNELWKQPLLLMLQGPDFIDYDSMCGSPVDLYDILPEDNTLNLGNHDGDEIILLLDYGDRILQFKRKKLYIINISEDLEYVESEHPHKGLTKKYHATKTSDGICWINQLGCYKYNGEEVINLVADKLQIGGDTDPASTLVFPSWESFFQETSSLGYIPRTNQLIVNQSVTQVHAYGNILVYDFQNESWTRGLDVITNLAMSNFVSTYDNSLVYSTINQGQLETVSVQETQSPLPGNDWEWQLLNTETRNVNCNIYNGSNVSPLALQTGFVLELGFMPLTDPDYRLVYPADVPQDDNSQPIMTFGEYLRGKIQEYIGDFFDFEIVPGELIDGMKIIRRGWKGELPIWEGYYVEGHPGNWMFQDADTQNVNDLIYGPNLFSSNGALEYSRKSLSNTMPAWRPGPYYAHPEFTTGSSTIFILAADVRMLSPDFRLIYHDLADGYNDGDYNCIGFTGFEGAMNAADIPTGLKIKHVLQVDYTSEDPYKSYPTEMLQFFGSLATQGTTYQDWPNRFSWASDGWCLSFRTTDGYFEDHVGNVMNWENQQGGTTASRGRKFNFGVELNSTFVDELSKDMLGEQFSFGNEILANFAGNVGSFDTHYYQMEFPGINLPDSPFTGSAARQCFVVHRQTPGIQGDRDPEMYGQSSFIEARFFKKYTPGIEVDTLSETGDPNYYSTLGDNIGVCEYMQLPTFMSHRIVYPEMPTIGYGPADYTNYDALTGEYRIFYILGDHVASFNANTSFIMSGVGVHARYAGKQMKFSEVIVHDFGQYYPELFPAGHAGGNPFYTITEVRVTYGDAIFYDDLDYDEWNHAETFTGYGDVTIQFLQSDEDDNFPGAPVLTPSNAMPSKKQNITLIPQRNSGTEAVTYNAGVTGHDSHFYGAMFTTQVGAFSQIDQMITDFDVEIKTQITNENSPALHDMNRLIIPGCETLYDTNGLSIGIHGLPSFTSINSSFDHWENYIPEGGQQLSAPFSEFSQHYIAINPNNTYAGQTYTSINSFQVPGDIYLLRNHMLSSADLTSPTPQPCYYAPLGYPDDMISGNYQGGIGEGLWETFVCGQIDDSGTNNGYPISELYGSNAGHIGWRAAFGTNAEKTEQFPLGKLHNWGGNIGAPLDSYFVALYIDLHRLRVLHIKDSGVLRIYGDDLTSYFVQGAVFRLNAFSQLIEDGMILDADDVVLPPAAKWVFDASDPDWSTSISQNRFMVQHSTYVPWGGWDADDDPWEVPTGYGPETLSYRGARYTEVTIQQDPGYSDISDNLINSARKFDGHHVVGTGKAVSVKYMWLFAHLPLDDGYETEDASRMLYDGSLDNRENETEYTSLSNQSMTSLTIFLKEAGPLSADSHPIMQSYFDFGPVDPLGGWWRPGLYNGENYAGTKPRSETISTPTEFWDTPVIREDPFNVNPKGCHPDCQLVVFEANRFLGKDPLNPIHNNNILVTGYVSNGIILRSYNNKITESFSPSTASSVYGPVLVIGDIVLNEDLISRKKVYEVQVNAQLSGSLTLSYAINGSSSWNVMIPEGSSSASPSRSHVNQDPIYRRESSFSRNKVKMGRRTDRSWATLKFQADNEKGIIENVQTIKLKLECDAGVYGFKLNDLSIVYRSLDKGRS